MGAVYNNLTFDPWFERAHGGSRVSPAHYTDSSGQTHSFHTDGGSVEDTEALYEYCVLEQREESVLSLQKQESKVTRSKARVYLNKVLEKEREQEEEEEENASFVRNIRERFDKAGVQMPTVQVRWNNLTLSAKVKTGTAALPSLTKAVFGSCTDCIQQAQGKTQKFKKHILSSMSGVLQPGRFTLLLGPPGSGKTTLLKALAGKSASNFKSSGEITYNGYGLHEFCAVRSAEYVDQIDTHLPELTVRETFDFSGDVLGRQLLTYSYNQLLIQEKDQGITPDPALAKYMASINDPRKGQHVKTDLLLKILMLDIAADTVVGGAMLRGISGGQKKRVTTGEMLMGQGRVLFLDEISTGLDSASTFGIVQSIKNWCHAFQGTVMIALLQPPPEVYNLFDDIMVLSEGKIIFHGPREGVLPFYRSLGFECPARKGEADFLQEITSPKDQPPLRKNQTPILAKYINFVPTEAFADCYQETSFYKEIKNILSEPFDRRRSHPKALSFNKYGTKWYQALQTVLKREAKLTQRNRFLFIFRSFQVIIMAVITGLLFLRLEKKSINDGNLFIGVGYYSLMFMQFGSMAQLSLGINRLPVFYKQRDNNFFPSWTYAMPTPLLQFPQAVVETVVWTLIVYFMVGFYMGAGEFFIFLLALLVFNMYGVVLFRTLGHLCRILSIAQSVGSFVLLVTMVTAGVTIARNDIPGWWIWAYWISVPAYQVRIIAINELKSPDWDQPFGDSGKTLGEVILEQRGFFTEEKYIWIGFVFTLGIWLLLNIVNVFALQLLNPIGSQSVQPEEKKQDEKKEIEMKQPSYKLIVKTATEDTNLFQNQNTLSISTTGDTSTFTDNNSSQISKFYSQTADVENYDQTKIEGKYSHAISKKPSLDFQKALKFQKSVLTFKNIKYCVDITDKETKTSTQLELLKGISGVFSPKVLVALMGESGAGKTTLMDVIAGRKTTGSITGDILIDGHPKEQATFARISGYVEQTDIHTPEDTVYEALLFSGRMRLPQQVGKETVRAYVEDVMEQIELDSLRNALVGLPGVSGLSVEQRKRLTIGVELVANPSIIFMDEPTSGLDARAAAIVMRTIRRIVDEGRTITCTIHQPSIDIFSAFDYLLLLKRGGRVIFNGKLGDECCNLIQYFQSISGVRNIRDGYNAATWMLEETSIAREQQLEVDFADIYEKSELHENLEAAVEENSVAAEGTQPLKFATRFPTTQLLQYRVCFKKQMINYWRSPPYNVVRYIITLLIALVFGSLYWDQGDKYTTMSGVMNIMGGLYVTSQFVGVMNSSTVQPVIGVMRTVFYREIAAGTYAVRPYAAAQTTVEIPFITVQAILYSVIVYFMIGFANDAQKFFEFLLFMWLNMFSYTYFGMMSVQVTPNLQIAAIFAGGFYGLFNLFAGFLIPAPDMGWWLRWYYYINPVAYALYGMVASQLGDINDEFVTIENPDTGETYQKTVSDFVEDLYGFKYNLRWLACGILVVFILIFRIAALFALKYVNFQKR